MFLLKLLPEKCLEVVKVIFEFSQMISSSHHSFSEIIVISYHQRSKWPQTQSGVKTFFIFGFNLKIVS